MSTTHVPAATYAARSDPTRGRGPIVVATDGEDGSSALATARRIAEHTGTSIVVVSAVESVPVPMVAFDASVAWIPDTEALVARRADRVARQLRATAGDGATWPVELVVDEPSRAIDAVARARHASLVVMGIGRHDLSARLLGGEVTLRTVRRSSVPVLAVGREPLPFPPRVAVVGVDFSPSSLHAARSALALLGDGGILHLVHAWSRSPIDYPDQAGHDAAYERALPGRLERFASALGERPHGVTIVPQSVLGSPVEQLVDFGRAHGADLLVAGRQGLGVIERLLIGRVTTGLLRRATAAVLVTPTPTPLEQEAAERALTGTSESRVPAEWAALLDDFGRRNAGRRTALEIDDPAIGAQAQETGYTLLGVTYDHRDHRVSLMLGAGTAGAPHLTRTLDHVTSIAVHTPQGGPDHALRLQHGDGQTLLTFLPA